MFQADRWRKLAIHSGLIVAGLVIGVVLAELTLRIVRPSIGVRSGGVESSNRQRPTGNPGWPLSRGEKTVVTPKQEARRIVVVGDSFTWGDGVAPQEAYPSVMEALLRERWPDQNIEVINWSRPGWNTWREFKSIAPQLPMLDPDLLIIGYCINDAEPIHRRQLREIRRIMLTAHRQPSNRVVVWLYNHSYLAALVYDFFENRRLRRAVTSYYQTLYEAGRSGWVRAQDAFALFDKATRTQSIPTLLVIFPIFDSQLDDRYGYRNLHSEIAYAASERGLDVLDLLPGFEGYDGRDLAVQPFSDAHPSPLAHRVAAQEIVEKIAELSGDLW